MPLGLPRTRSLTHEGARRHGTLQVIPAAGSRQQHSHVFHTLLLLLSVHLETQGTHYSSVRVQ